LPVPRLEDVQRQRHAGKQHYRQGEEWELVLPTHFITGFAHYLVGYAKGLWQTGAQGRKEAQKSAPAFVLGNGAGAIEHTV